MPLKLFAQTFQVLSITSITSRTNVLKINIIAGDRYGEGCEGYTKGNDRLVFDLGVFSAKEP